MKRFKGFAIPYFVWLSLLVVVPLVLMLVLTFLHTDGMNLTGAQATLSNYVELTDITYWEALLWKINKLKKYSLELHT